MRIGRENTFCSAVVAERIDDTRWYTHKEVCERIPALNERVIDRSIAWLHRLGIVVVEDSRVRLDAQEFAKRLRAMSQTGEKLAQVSRRNGGGDGDDTFVCKTCGATYTVLEATSTLNTDKDGFFCVCGGDMCADGADDDEAGPKPARQSSAELAPLLHLLDQAEETGLPFAAPPLSKRKRGKSDSGGKKTNKRAKQSKNL